MIKIYRQSRHASLRENLVGGGLRNEFIWVLKTKLHLPSHSILAGSFDVLYLVELVAIVPDDKLLSLTQLQYVIEKISYSTKGGRVVQRLIITSTTVQFYSHWIHHALASIVGCRWVRRRADMSRNYMMSCYQD